MEEITYWRGTNLGFHRKEWMKKHLRLHEVNLPTEEEIEEMAHNYAYKKRRGEYMNPAKRHRIQENFIAGAKAIMDKLKD